VLDEVSDTFLGRGYESGPILPGSSYFRTNSVRLPVRQSGTYYIFFRADLGNALGESTISNNLSVQAITLDIQQPDLTPLSFQVPTVVTSSPNPVLKLSWGVTNQGNGSTSSYWY